MPTMNTIARQFFALLLTLGMASVGVVAHAGMAGGLECQTAHSQGGHVAPVAEDVHGQEHAATLVQPESAATPVHAETCCTTICVTTLDIGILQFTVESALYPSTHNSLAAQLTVSPLTDQPERPPRI